MSYLETLSEHRRITILRYLSDISGYTSNGSILADVCNGYGVTTTRDQMRTDLRWLAEQGMVRLTEQHDFLVAMVTERGVEVARGRAFVDGVRRPGAD